MTLIDYVHALRRRWRTVVATVLLGVIGAAGITLLLPRVYATSATSFVSINEPGGQANSPYQNLKFALNQVPSYTGLADGPSVLEPVISELHLSMTPEELAAHISASNPAGTVLLTVQADGSSPGQAKRIANAVAVQLGKEIESLETPRTGGASPVKVAVAVPAGLPSTPVSPRPALNLMIGILLGLASGVTIAIAREQMDTTIMSPDELYDFAGVAPLGSVADDASFEKHPLAAASQDSPDIEAFRSIRTTLQFVDPDGLPRQVLVTSATSDEGKTITACNLAIAMAQTSRRVCLVEGNLRRPTIGQYLGLDRTVGLTDVLAGRHPLTEALASRNGDQLTVLQAGTTTPPDPSRLLESPSMSDLLASLRESFDMLIIDAPPLLSVSDPAVLAQTSDVAILVARYGHTRRQDFSAAIQDLQAVNARVIGAILTRVPAPKKARSTRTYGYDRHDPDLRSEQPTGSASSPASVTRVGAGHSACFWTHQAAGRQGPQRGRSLDVMLTRLHADTCTDSADSCAAM